MNIRLLQNFLSFIQNITSYLDSAYPKTYSQTVEIDHENIENLTEEIVKRINLTDNDIKGGVRYFLNILSSILRIFFGVICLR